MEGRSRDLLEDDLRHDLPSRRLHEKYGDGGIDEQASGQANGRQ
jgi:hypothetical protein